MRIQVCLKIYDGINNGHDSPNDPQVDAGTILQVEVDKAEDGAKDFKQGKKDLGYK